MYLSVFLRALASFHKLLILNCSRKNIYKSLKGKSKSKYKITHVLVLPCQDCEDFDDFKPCLFDLYCNCDFNMHSFESSVQTFVQVIVLDMFMDVGCPMVWLVSFIFRL